MNPKYPTNLDPKLREAYDRVMGTGVPPAKAQPQPKPEAPQQPVKMVTEPAPAPMHKPQTNDNDSGVVHFSPDTHTKHKKSEEKPEVNQPANTTPAEAKSHTSSSATPILLGIIGIIFLLGYALFWAQIFGFNIIPAL
jgi:outer membrane biosynthesis protein TonB